MKLEVLTRDSEFTQLEAAWQLLHQRCAAPELCSSWWWLHCWWTTYRQPHWQLYLVCGYQDERLVIIAPYYLHGRRLCLMGKGEPEAEEVCSEFVDLLVDDECREAALQALSGFMQQRLPGFACVQMQQISEGALIHQFWRQLPVARICTRSGMRYRVPLAATLPATLENLPSGNLRKKTQRLHNQLQSGRYRVETFDCYDRFEQGWELLQLLHQQRWRSRGQQGALSSQRFKQFHRQLFRAQGNRRLAMILVLYDTAPLAAIYCFVDQYRVYYYQSGFRQGAAGSPGVLAHVAILERICGEADEYDFMRGGQSSYKADWASRQTPVLDLTVYPPGLAGRLAFAMARARSILKRCKSRFRQRVNR